MTQSFLRGAFAALALALAVPLAACEAEPASTPEKSLGSGASEASALGRVAASETCTSVVEGGVLANILDYVNELGAEVDAVQQDRAVDLRDRLVQETEVASEQLRPMLVDLRSPLDQIVEATDGQVTLELEGFKQGAHELLAACGYNSQPSGGTQPSTQGPSRPAPAASSAEPVTVDGTYVGDVTVTEDWSNEGESGTRVGETFRVQVSIPAQCASPAAGETCQAKYTDLFEDGSDFYTRDFEWSRDDDKWILSSPSTVTNECVGGGSAESTDDITLTFDAVEGRAESVAVAYEWDTTQNPSNECVAGFHTDGDLKRR